ncbi:hypothetical protein HG530_005447 [Fusarium avenaceum]|nr:hypothetical protein HG530_005447 [Fusarium avenaceum]
MVAEHDTINTILNRQLDILHRLHALQHNRHRALLSNPLQVLPRKALVNILPHQPAESTALAVLAALTTAHRRLDNDGLWCSLVGFALSRDGGVDGDEDCFDAERASAAE